MMAVAPLRYLTEQLECPVAFIGTYPPQECGIATFTYDLSDAVFKLNSQIGSFIVAVSDAGDSYQYSDKVKFVIKKENRQSYLEAAAFLNASDVGAVNIQHEFGIFGGSEGEYILTLLAHLEKPVVVTLHTTIPQPTLRLKELTQLICGYATTVVGSTAKSVEILQDVYEISATKLKVVHHGVPDVKKMPTTRFKKVLQLSDRKVLLTFGLLNRGKGIEYALEAMPSIIKEHPDAIYLILGETHPVIRRIEGESYREMLEQKVAALGLEEHVMFKDEYLNFDDLIRYLMATDVYLTPNLSKDQIVSGTLAYAVGCGKAIVSTPYLYALDILADGRGMLIKFRDSESISKSVNKILGDKVYKAQMERATYRYGRQMIWPNVAKKYASLFNEIVGEKMMGKHLRVSKQIQATQELAKGSFPVV